ncbi:hypothetical protein ACQCSX_02135 [Pseudarthrobacter sp. P1]|uniref:hypothetical protein n=1 Tax=Pseudarthrobacter sp. P1 TaxID=3418418 RepID=UPI003CEE264A
MATDIEFTCPVEGCEYSCGFRLGMEQEEDVAEYAERLEILRAEHPNHAALRVNTTMDFEKR